LCPTQKGVFSFLIRIISYPSVINIIYIYIYFACLVGETSTNHKYPTVVKII
jgi:hypothetical protein